MAARNQHSLIAVHIGFVNRKVDDDGLPSLFTLQRVAGPGADNLDRVAGRAEPVAGDLELRVLKPVRQQASDLTFVMHGALPSRKS